MVKITDEEADLFLFLLDKWRCELINNLNLEKASNVGKLSDKISLQLDKDKETNE